MPGKTTTSKKNTTPPKETKTQAKAPETKAKVQPKKEETPVAPAPAPAPVAATPTPAPVKQSTPVTQEAGSQTSVITDFNVIRDALSALVKQAKEVNTQLKNLERRVFKEHKELEKSSRGRRKKSSNGEKSKRKPSGFAKPARLSLGLCEFLGVDEETELPRTSVTKKITEYVKEHDLQNPANKKEIMFMKDAKLKKLLDVPQGDVLTYFNLQRYMKVHFIKPEIPAVVLAAALAAAPVAVQTTA